MTEQYNIQDMINKAETLEELDAVIDYALTQAKRRLGNIKYAPYLDNNEEHHK